MRLVLAILTGLFLLSCTEKVKKPKEWVYQKTIKLNGVNPIGITELNGKLWLSDGDHNRLAQIDPGGKILKIIDSLERPMHIASWNQRLYVPQYGNDAIAVLKDGTRADMQLQDSLDAPAGIWVCKNQIAIADFYNNRILFNDGSGWISFGKEGKGEGEFYYPTDVQITDSLIWVADAYNHRVQAFDKAGNFLKMMGQDQKINASTGIFITHAEVFVTDFENDRVLVLDEGGALKQVLKEGIQKATDVLLTNGLLYIVNYRSGELVLYAPVEKAVK